MQAYPEKYEKKKAAAVVAAAPVAASASGEDGALFTQVDIRVGRVIKADKHPDADSLYVEQIDVGEAEPRTVVSGLVGKVELQDFVNRDVLVVCNLKPVVYEHYYYYSILNLANQAMRGIKSFAMVLAASNSDKVELCDPPAGSKPGDRIFAKGFEGKPEEQLNPKKKVFEAVSELLTTSSELVVTYKGIPLQTTLGNITVKSIVGATVK